MTEPTALAFVCTLERPPTPSSSELLARQVLDELGKQGVHGQMVRAVDHNIARPPTFC